jgi:hypothetical protein
MKKENNNLILLKSFKPVFIKDWFLAVSLDETRNGILVILFHRYEHVFRCSYVIGQDEAAKFIEHIIEIYK